MSRRILFKHVYKQTEKKLVTGFKHKWSCYFKNNICITYISPIIRLVDLNLFLGSQPLKSFNEVIEGHLWIEPMSPVFQFGHEKF